MYDSGLSLRIANFLKKHSKPNYFFVTFTKAIYSASTKEVTTDICFFEDYEIHPPVTSKTKPPTKCLALTLSAQFELV